MCKYMYIYIPMYLAIAIHNFPEGLATFLATVIDRKVSYMCLYISIKTCSISN